MTTDCPLCRDPGALIAAPRHVPDWADLTAAEQFALLVRIGEVLTAGAQGIAASSVHGHFHLRPIDGSAGAATRLTTGGADPLLPLVTRDIDRAERVDLAVAFAMRSGVSLLKPWFEELLERKGRLRVVVGDYMDVTEPAALRLLLDLDGAEVHLHETGTGSFHPKAWLFRAADRTGAAVVGSSNLSRTALTTGVEWNLHSEGAADQVDAAFEALLSDPRTHVLTEDRIAAYAERRRAAPLSPGAQQIVATEPPAPPPEPHEIQRSALAALATARNDGALRGLVVLATGLGKTWLAAFDSAPFARVLFVAHRAEILAQAMAAFRRIRPEARFGRFDGEEKDEGAEILFASIQTIGRAGHLRRFAPDAFDYIVVDEFHHASAASYRKLLDHFTPRFLLGLTATPDRSDGADLLALCDDREVFRCDLFQGIEAGLLSPFRYMGVPDEVDYAQIPWRSAQFDPEALEAALATGTRAANALEQFLAHRSGPAIGFCCSKRHADFMAEFFAARGIRAVAVHSGPSSAPRATSLERLGRGEIDILFAVDMFNEGVDVPEIGTVMMLRPTESVILWLQQLGRGLRRIEGKILRVIDYIGNHRIFLTKVRALLEAGPGDGSLAMRLEAILAGTASLPDGCSVTYDLEVVEMLREMLRPKSGAEDLEAQYRDFRLRNGKRPRAAEIAQMGFDPARTGHGGWFHFVRDMGDLPDTRVLDSHGSLLRQLERETSLAGSDLRALSAMLAGGTALGEGIRLWAPSPLF
ncbi:DEAD/DEAH box helicase family protein [Mangrovicoccus ximenensis]|uniref:DEAD/DEAH box helicase family protein n=1 Tax=Mangrovicoccus ximenensis TaxID=1911570 RepID=UPI000D386B1B|nr:DEAD/DEAH box helicase family protein [Mangrovicoccus ximenensis]